MILSTFRSSCANLIVLFAVSWAVTASCTTAAAQELLGYWAFEETDTDADAADSSGNGLNGEYEGDVDPNVDGAPNYGSGAHFDGLSGQVYIGPGDENAFGDLTSNFSVMAWINPDQFAHKNRIFGSSPWVAQSGWGWGTNGDQLELTTWGVKDYTQPVPLELEEWSHVAVVLDEEFEAHFYVDGEFVGTQTHPDEGGPTFNEFYVGYACCDQEHFEGRLDEVAVFDGVLSEAQIVNAMTLGVLNFDGNPDPLAPLDDGTLTDPQERADYVHNVLGTWIGDSNLDGEFNSGDLVAVFAAGKYEVDAKAGWAEGDWNGDMRFGSGDLVVAFTDGGYEQGIRPMAAAVPEPSSLVLLVLAGACLIRFRRK